MTILPLYIDVLIPFLSEKQLACMQELANGEEGQFYIDKAASIANTIISMPVTFDQEHLGDEAMVYLHYFYGSADWYISEKDIDGDVDQAFGYANLGMGGELGYISIRELVGIGAELDLHWKPTSLRLVKAKNHA